MMWAGPIEHCPPDACAQTGRALEVALAHARTADWAALADGRHALPEGVVAILARADGRGRAIARLETHDTCWDAQLILEGVEVIGVAPRSHCIHPEPADPDAGDIRFYRDPPEIWIRLTPGEVALFGPDDAHAPLAGEGAVRKVVYKIPVQKQ
jgi:biofilm protein TabA